MGGIQIIGEDAFDGCLALNHIKINDKPLIISETRGRFVCRFVTEGTIPPSASKHVVIAPDCFRSMRAEEISRVRDAIAAMEILADLTSLGFEYRWDRMCEQIRALLAPHEARHREKMEASTLLELCLWKNELVAEDTDPKLREACRVTCGADDIIKNVVSFL